MGAGGKERGGEKREEEKDKCCEASRYSQEGCVFKSSLKEKRVAPCSERPWVVGPPSGYETSLDGRACRDGSVDEGEGF